MGEIRTGSPKPGAAGRRRRSGAGLERELARVTGELEAARRQLAVTADVLRIISRSRFDLQNVLDLLTVAAANLCGADMSGLTRPDADGLFRYETNYRYHPDWLELVNRIRFSPDRGTVVGRTLAERRPVQVDDVLADPEYALPDMAIRAGFRTLLGVPLLRDGEPIGVFALGRKSVSPFSEHEIGMLVSFADQAVIAIENARLLDELQDKTRMLEAADRYKSHFLVSASHDLRQPLHALNLFVAQLRSRPDRSTRARLLANIESAVQSMNELFASLLDMARLEAGTVHPNSEVFPVSRLYDRVVTTFVEFANEKELEFVVVPSSAWTRSDFVLLDRVLLNLVSNAVRYTDAGCVLLGCRRRGDRLRIDVYNTGPSISPEEQQKIFSEFYRGTDRDDDAGAGFGLGLAIVDRLCQVLGHQVEMESWPTGGSRFSVYVPRAEPAPQPDPETGRQPVVDPLAGKRVLVVDDDPLVLQGMDGILRSWGCDVSTVGSVDEALGQLARQTGAPDLIVSDYRLEGGETGIDAIEQIRKASGRRVPALLISGDTAPEALQDASARKLTLVHKPVTPLRMRAVLTRLLQESPEPD